MVIGESRIGEGVVGSSATEPLLERLLEIISGGTFPPPGKRESMTPGQRRQLRDAMILEAHSRESRDIFVTKDERGFIRAGRREALEHLCGTRIMTIDEVCAFLDSKKG
jgi:hypothetical protein